MANGREREPGSREGIGEESSWIKAGEARVRERRSRDPRAAQPREKSLDSSPIPSRLAPITSRLRGSLSLPFAINKARALGRQSRQLRRLENQQILSFLLLLISGSSHFDCKIAMIFL